MKAEKRQNELQQKLKNKDIRSLNERVKGDALLDAEDLIETVKEVGGEVDELGYITVYRS